MTPAISLAQVTELAPGSWVEEPFTAIVAEIKEKEVKKTKKKFWVLTLRDTTGSAFAESSVFTAPQFGPGDQIEVSGKGVKYDENSYGKKISWGDKATVVVVSHAPQKEDWHPSGTDHQRAPVSSNPAPHAVHDKAPTRQPLTKLEKYTKFHRGMKKLSLLRVQCFEYASLVVGKAVAGGFIAFPEGDGKFFRSECISTVSSGLFIEATKRGLDEIVPAIGAPPPAEEPKPAPAPAAPPPAAPPPAAKPPPSEQRPPDRAPAGRQFPEGNPTGQAFPTNGPDEDVPF